MLKNTLATALLACTAFASPALAQTLTTDFSTWQSAVGTYGNDTAYGDELTDISSLPLDGGPTLNFGSAVNVRQIGSSWGTWSGGYTGQVLFSNGANSLSVSLSPTTTDFGFYAEPDTFDVFTISLNLTGGGSISQLVDGNGGAAFFGWYGGGVSSFTITTDDTDFAFGNFYYSDATGTVPEPATWALMIGGFGMVGGAMRHRATKVAYAA